ncbi:acyltransferase family protein [Floridanema evergladense]|uniref:Acyltransferase family protein n=1 Tax=Floridaenema evergladense BLCC-F167 TaxID=3153639 RepID=A0ABV4WQW2_9CYAN
MEISANSGDSYPKSEPTTLAKKEQKFEAFDFLRAIFSLAIVAYKTKIYNIPKILLPNNFTRWLSDYVLNGMVGALAVPVFLQVSLFLFYNKSEKTGFKYFIQKRLPRLIYLYVFWVGAITLYDVLFFGGFEVIRKATSSIKTFAEFIMSGNSTPYFFFFSLIFVTVLAEILILLFSKIEKPATKINLSYWLLIVSSILVFSFSTIQPIIKYTGIQSPFLNFISNLTGWDYTPVNFLPYVFTSIITAQEYKEGKLAQVTTFLRLKLYGLLGLTLFFFTIEWVLTSNGLLIQVDQAPLDHYLRLSLVFGSWLLLYLGIVLKPQVPAIIAFLSSCSLGIYGFHVFFIFQKPLPLGSIPVMGNLLQAVPVLFILTNFFVVSIASIALTVLFKRIKIFKQFV